MMENGHIPDGPWYNPAWQCDVEPGENFVFLWDCYGFFAHISHDCWFTEVMELLPENYTPQQLELLVREFFRKYEHLYCGCN